MSKITNISNIKINDPFVGVFRNNLLIENPRSYKQLLNVWDFATNEKKLAVRSNDVELTKFIRFNSKNLGRFFDMGRLTQRPMLSFVRAALMLPRDNSIGCDYLTYDDPRYRDFILDLMDLLVSLGQEDAARILPINYGANPPYYSDIRSDGLMQVDDRAWSPQHIGLYNEIITAYCEEKFSKFSQDDNLMMICPPLNSDKGVGFYRYKPGMVPIDGRDFWESYFILPDIFAVKGIPGHKNIWARFNGGPFKLEWLDSRALLDNFEFFLSNSDQYQNSNTLLKAFLRGACSVHTMAYRINGGKPILNDLSGGARKACSEGFFTKDGEVSFENDDFTYYTAQLDNKRYSDAFRHENPSVWTALLRKRPIYPGATTTFGLPFQILLRALLHDFEESITGFWAAQPNKLLRYHRFHQDTESYGKALFTCDRTTSEHFITDNFDKVLLMLPPKFSSLMKAFCTSIVPSKQGPRVCTGLISGGTPTTFLNVLVGLFEQGLLVSSILCERVGISKMDEILKLYWTYMLHPEKPYFVYDDFAICSACPTDDNAFYIAHKQMSDEQVAELIKNACNKLDLDKRFLRYEIGFDQNVFGMRLTRDDVSMAKTLGLNKIFLFEGEKLGDRIALKYTARLKMLPDYYQDIQRLFTKHHFGSLSDYENGAANYLASIRKFGFTSDGSAFGVDESFIRSLFNEYNPSEKLILGRVLEDLGFDPTEYTDRVPFEYVRELYDAFYRSYK